MDSIGYLPANRSSLKRSAELIQKGNVVVIFPEGGRNPQKVLKRGKRGAAVIALLSGCYIIPIGSFGPKTYGLKEGEYAGEFVPNVTMETEEGKEETTGGLVLTAPGGLSRA